MVFETLEADSRFGLMVTTGYKAGLPLVFIVSEPSVLAFGALRFRGSA